jgi:hypothetical protein
MSVLMKHSTLLAYLAQVAQLDDMLDSDEFQGTVFAPCNEYAARYWCLFNGKVDVHRAREFVLAAVLRKPMTQRDIFYENGVDIPWPGVPVAVLPTMHRYTQLRLSMGPNRTLLLDPDLVVSKCDLTCTNGVVHLLNGLIEPEVSI